MNKDVMPLFQEGTLVSVGTYPYEDVLYGNFHIFIPGDFSTDVFGMRWRIRNTLISFRGCPPRVAEALSNTAVIYHLRNQKE